MRVLLLGLLASISLASAVTAQSVSPSPEPASAAPAPTQLALTTAYPSITISGGEEAIFPLQVQSPLNERVDLSVEDVPDGFVVSLRGGDAIVSSVFTNAAEPPPLEMRVRAPKDAPPGPQVLSIAAMAASGQVVLPVDVLISDVEGGSVSLESKYPVLSGDSDATYTFDLTLVNDTARDITFGLQGGAPDGWTVDVRPAGADKAATALVTAGGKTNLKVTADPPRFAPAGRYLIGVTADGDGQLAEAQLGVEITGSHALSLDTPDGRLNDTVSAGGSEALALLVTNTGTAPTGDVKLSARSPKGWQVTFEPESISDLQPGAVSQVQANIQPAGNAVAGDYVLTLTASSAEASDDVEIRSTVETSPAWGVVAVGVIALAIAGLGLVFRRYGRR